MKNKELISKLKNIDKKLSNISQGILELYVYLNDIKLYKESEFFYKLLNSIESSFDVIDSTIKKC